MGIDKINYKNYVTTLRRNEIFIWASCKTKKWIIQSHICVIFDFSDFSMSPHWRLSKTKKFSSLFFFALNPRTRQKLKLYTFLFLFARIRTSPPPIISKCHVKEQLKKSKIQLVKLDISIFLLIVQLKTSKWSEV